MSTGQPQQPPQAKKVIYSCPSCGLNVEVDLVNGFLPNSMKCTNCGFVYYFPGTQAPPNPSEQWSPENVENIIKLVDTLAAKYLTFKKDEAEAEHNRLRTLTRYNSLLTAILTIILGVIVALMSYLTILGPVNGEALLFLVGTITGYILLFIQRLTKNLFWNGNEEEEEQ